MYSIRSGSSFVGEFFNQRPNSMYWYEPLWPWRPCTETSNDTLNKDGPTWWNKLSRMKAVEAYFSCELGGLQQMYAEGFAYSGAADSEG